MRLMQHAFLVMIIDHSPTPVVPKGAPIFQYSAPTCGGTKEAQNAGSQKVAAAGWFRDRVQHIDGSKFIHM